MGLFFLDCRCMPIFPDPPPHEFPKSAVEKIGLATQFPHIWVKEQMNWDMNSSLYLKFEDEFKFPLIVNSRRIYLIF